MKLTKENVCVFIEDEAQLEQARELLVRYNERIDERTFYLMVGTELNFLQIDRKKQWTLGSKPLGHNKLCKLKEQITLTELEQILKHGKEN